MSKLEKLIERLKAKPADFTYRELQTLLEALGFHLKKGGHATGSKVEFAKGDLQIMLHKPHPEKEVKRVYLKQIIEILQKEGLL